MPIYPVLQPDGKLAVWSTVVDHFIALNCSVEEAIGIISQRHSGDVRSAVESAASGSDPFPPYGDWDMRLAWALYRFGENDETVISALSISPNQKAARWYCDLIRAEVAKDEAIFERDTAIARAETAEAALAEWKLLGRQESERAEAAIARAETAEAALATERVALREFAKGALLRTMHDLSEACWCAGWLHGMEYFLWNVAENGQAVEWGMDNVYQRDVDDLRRLRELADGWWVWDDEKFETFVSLDEMQRLAVAQP